MCVGLAVLRAAVIGVRMVMYATASGTWLTLLAGVYVGLILATGEQLAFAAGAVCAGLLFRRLARVGRRPRLTRLAAAMAVLFAVTAAAGLIASAASLAVIPVYFAPSGFAASPAMSAGTTVATYVASIAGWSAFAAEMSAYVVAILVMLRSRRLLTDALRLSARRGVA